MRFKEEETQHPFDLQAYARECWGSLSATAWNSSEPKFICASLIIQSINIYIAPFQDPYSNAFPNQAKRKRIVFRSWWNWAQTPFERCLRSEGSPFQVVGPTTVKELLCIAKRTNETAKSPWTEDRILRWHAAQEERGRYKARVDWRAPSQICTSTPRAQSCRHMQVKYLSVCL